MMVMWITIQPLGHAMQSKVLVYTLRVNDGIFCADEDGGPGRVGKGRDFVWIQAVGRPVKVPLEEIGHAL